MNKIFYLNKVLLYENINNMINIKYHKFYLTKF